MAPQLPTFVLTKEAAQQVLGMTREAAAGNATHMQIFVPMIQQLCECFITAHDEILRREQKLETLGEELAAVMGTELWCMHIQGPDDVHAAPSKAHAERAAELFNARFVGVMDVLCKAVVEPWPHSPESHAADVEKFCATWFAPAVDGAAATDPTCPFCHSANTGIASDDPEETTGYVKCHGCGARGPVACDNEAIVASWNRRAAAAVPAGGDAVRLRAVIERDRRTFADCVEAMHRVINQHSWMVDSRGSYEWDDKRYQDEFGDALTNIRAEVEKLAARARDMSDSPSSEAELRAALVVPAALNEERRKFQQETLRTSELTQMLSKFVEEMHREHEQGAWSKGCVRCQLVAEAKELLSRPIKLPAAPAPRGGVTECTHCYGSGKDTSYYGKLPIPPCPVCTLPADDAEPKARDTDVGFLVWMADNMPPTGHPQLAPSWMRAAQQALRRTARALAAQEKGL
jgi:Lar family restriction alleviation protein